MNKPNCDICTLLEAPKNLVFKTSHWQVTLAPDQAYLGRSYVTLLRHKESLSELSAAEWKDFEALARRLENAYEQALGGGRPFNWACMMNNAFQSKSPSPHVHWHVRPRFKGSKSIMGVIFNDPDYGYHYDRQRQMVVTEPLLEEILNRLKKNLAGTVKL